MKMLCDRKSLETFPNIDYDSAKGTSVALISQQQCKFNILTFYLLVRVFQIPNTNYRLFPIFSRPITANKDHFPFKIMKRKNLNN